MAKQVASMNKGVNPDGGFIISFLDKNGKPVTDQNLILDYLVSNQAVADDVFGNKANKYVSKAPFIGNPTYDSFDRYFRDAYNAKVDDDNVVFVQSSDEAFNYGTENGQTPRRFFARGRDLVDDEKSISLYLKSTGEDVPDEGLVYVDSSGNTHILTKDAYNSYIDGSSNTVSSTGTASTSDEEKPYSTEGNLRDRGYPSSMDGYNSQSSQTQPASDGISTTTGASDYRYFSITNLRGDVSGECAAYDDKTNKFLRTKYIDPENATKYGAFLTASDNYIQSITDLYEKIISDLTATNSQRFYSGGTAKTNIAYLDQLYAHIKDYKAHIAGLTEATMQSEIEEYKNNMIRNKHDTRDKFTKRRVSEIDGAMYNNSQHPEHTNGTKESTSPSLPEDWGNFINEWTKERNRYVCIDSYEKDDGTIMYIHQRYTRGIFRIQNPGSGYEHLEDVLLSAENDGCPRKITPVYQSYPADVEYPNPGNQPMGS